jgi:immune inhibitor A
MPCHVPFSRVPAAPQVIAQLYANYKRSTKGVVLSFRDYLKVIGYAGREAEVKGRDKGRALAGESLVEVPRYPISGTLQIIVLLVDFADNVGRRPARQFEDMLFSRQAFLTGSMREFYAEASQNKVDVVGAVHGWMRMPQPYSYYVNKQSGTGRYPRNAQRLAEHALAAAQAEGVVFDQQLDKFGNKMITGLFVVHAGMGAEVMPSVSLQAKHIWSHKADMQQLYPVSPTLSAATYLTVPEDANMGVCAHELGHLAFQWDDFYDPNYAVDGKWEGAGNWDLMAGGSWNNGGNSPAHPAALHKSQHQWVAVKEVSSSTHLVLPPYGEAGAVIARLKGRQFGPTQSIILENRLARGFDAHLPGAGLLVWRVDTDLEMGGANRPAMMLIQADGRHDLETGNGQKGGDTGDPFPGSGNNHELGDTGTISTSFPGQAPSGISLRNIALDPISGNIELDVHIE